jgi:hypothetical protein
MVPRLGGSVADLLFHQDFFFMVHDDRLLDDYGYRVVS